MSAYKDLVDNSISAFESDTWTSIPAVVTALSDSGDQTMISAKPVLNSLLRGSSSTPLPEILEIPVMWPGSSTSLVRGVLSVGDWVLLIFSCRPLQNWLNGDGSRVDPESFQKMNYNSAIAIPGLFPFKSHVGSSANQTLADDQADMVVKSNIGTSVEAEVRIKANGDVIVTPAGGAVLTLGADGTATLDGDLQVNGTIDSTGDITSTADVVSSLRSLNNHEHTYIGAGAGSSTQVTTPTP